VHVSVCKNNVAGRVILFLMRWLIEAVAVCIVIVARNSQTHQLDFQYCVSTCCVIVDLMSEQCRYYGLDVS